MARVLVQTGCPSVYFGAVVVCRAGCPIVSYLCEQDQRVSTSSYVWTYG